MSAWTVEKSLAFLDSFTNYEKASGYRYTEKTFSLSRMRKLAAAFGNPQNSFPSVHVAGTTGKGSTCIITASLLSASGYRVGLYTSPHLLDFCERIQIVKKIGRRKSPSPLEGEGWGKGDILFEKVQQKFIIEQTARIKKFLESHKQFDPTTFELYTLLAFLYFAHVNVDIAIIEVGMGGRLDATNIVKPLCCAITRIGHDHRAQLGGTLAKIAQEKAGIIKRGISVVCAPQSVSEKRVIQNVCEEKNAPLVYISSPLMGEDKSEGEKTPSPLAGEGYKKFLQKHGSHQRVNVETALCILNILEKKKFHIRWNAVSHLHELHPVLLPARIQKVRNNPPVFVDGGHNPPAAKALSDFLKQNFGNKRGVLVFQIFKDKEIENVLKILLLHFHTAYVPKLLFPRSTPPQKLKEACRAQRAGCRVVVCKSVRDAMKKALKDKSTPFVVSTGSFYLAAEILGTGF